MPDFGGALDTPRTNIGDATYLSRQPDFADISQEASFQSPAKDGNLLQQLRNGGRSNGINLRTPRQRGPLADRRNLPPSVGGAEFTPLLKSATRNSVRRFGKENGTAMPNTPTLDRIDEGDVTSLPRMDTSIYTGSRNQSYFDNTLPQVDTSSTASTPIAVPPRRGGDKGPLQDGNQLSLREQENVIDRIEKENFGLKLKIHFLEEALRKAGPGFSEAALKENTELKVDKVTMQRELHRYKKHLTTAEKDLESYRQSMLELQEKAKRKYANENQRAEIERLQRLLEDREADVANLERQINEDQRGNDEIEKLRDDIGDLEADLREKDRIITEREDELEDLKDKMDEVEEKAKDSQRKIVELEEKATNSEELEEAKDTISDLEINIRRLEEQIEEMKTRMEDAETRMEDALAQKERAETDLEELQDEMANKSVVTKGLSRQIEEKVIRLQEELDKSGQEYATLEKELSEVNRENEGFQIAVKDLQRNQENFDRERHSLQSRVEELQAEFDDQSDAKNLLQSRHEALTKESATLQRNVTQLEKETESLEQSLAEEREHALEIERDLRSQYQGELDRLNDEISDLQAEIREKDNLYDNDSEKWETEKQNLESERERAEGKAAGLQRTIDRLQEVEGTLSDKESKLQAAIQGEAERHRSEEGILTRQIEDLQDALETRQTLLTNLRNELSTVRDELRQTQVDYQSQLNKVAALEDEVDILQTSLDKEQGSGRRDLDAGRRELESERRQLETSRRECDDLREQLRTLRERADSAQAASLDAQQSTESATRLKWQLSDMNAQLERITKEKQTLQDQLAKNTLDLHSVSSSLAEAKAERDELEAELRRAKLYDNETIRVDQERVDLRTAKLKLDNDVRRLKEENRVLMDQREAIEKTLEEEIEKSAEEEERLNQEVLELQSRLRQSSSNESHELGAARRTIRELERRVEDMETQLKTGQMPIEGNSELSLIRKDLTAARQKELDFIQRESANRDIVKGLKRHISDLERQVHESEISRLIVSPKSSASDSGRKSEVAELRRQLSTAQQSIHELRSKNREAERKTQQVSHDFQRQLNDLEDQKVVLEEVLDEARQQAEETAIQHDRILKRMKHKLEKAERERDAVAVQQTDTSKQDRQLRKNRAEMENLEHDVREQQELIESLAASEASLRRKLDRARSERAAFRLSAEKLQKDLERAKAAASKEAKLPTSSSSSSSKQRQALETADQALETVIRAAESAEERHKKELRGMVMQMEWMQARWKREASLRADAAYAKKFLQLQLDVANACNKAQLRELEDIRTNILGNRKPLVLPSKKVSSSLSSSSKDATTRPTLKTFLVMARFIARMRLSARDWAKQETVRQRIVVATQEQRKVKRSRQLKVVRVEA